MKIHNLNYTIKYDKDIPDEYLGFTYYHLCLITIKPNLAPDQEKVTIIHEIVHAYLDALGMINMKKFDHEQICEFIAHNLDQINSSYKEAIKELKTSIKKKK